MAITEFTGQYRWLSNFYPCEVEFDGYVFTTVEHAYQAAKTLDLDQRLYISMLEMPGQAKKAGRNVTLRSDWENVKVHIMRDLLRQKFTQPKFRALLLATGDQHIEEGNYWGDRYWGVSPVGSGKGQNILGRLIMQVRREIQK